MLLRFGVGNLKSIRDYYEVSLVASDALKDKGPKLLSGPRDKFRVLPFVLIYGANASGKSALYHAMGAIKDHVQKSFIKRGPEEPIDRAPFALDPDFADLPTRLDCDFILDDVRYHYGFEFNDEHYTKEWLFSYPDNHRRILFTRNEPKNIEFGASLRGRNQVIADLTRPNALFLSAAAQNGHAQLTPVYTWFTNQLYGVVPSINTREIQKRLSVDLDDRLVPFLTIADTGILGVNVESLDPPESIKNLYRSIKDVVKQSAPEEGVEIEVRAPENLTSVTLAHAARGGLTVDLPLTAESRGTRRLINILWSAFKILDSGGVLFVDELDASLHTLIAMKLLELFSDSDFNSAGAQLIATTHDTNILCSSQVRRDQIWFTEKDAEGATHIYPLTDIRTRNTDNLEKGYLQGRFGAIPFLGSVQELCAGVENG